MGGIQKGHKVSDQSWRRKPRKFAPKSRLGCKTCKIRRVKCDLSQPFCLKCHSTGRTCDGYKQSSPLPIAQDANNEPHCYQISKRKSYESSTSSMSIAKSNRTQWDAQGFDPFLQNLEPLMLLPAAGSDQAEAIYFFELITIENINGYRPCELWRQTLMFFCQTVPSVRHAATALALMHRDYLKRTSEGPTQQLQFLKHWQPEDAPLLYYNRAIQSLLRHENTDSIEAMGITLMVCYLFTCFEHLAGNDVQAMNHLRGGVKLCRHVVNATRKNNIMKDKTLSVTCTPINQIIEQIQRLDMQAVTFLVDWTPAEVEETFQANLPSSEDAFLSLDQAADRLQILVAQAMRLRNTEQQICPMGDMPPLPLSLHNLVLEQLEAWSNLFNDLLKRLSFNETNLEAHRQVSTMKLQHVIIWTLLSGYGPGKEMDYDPFLPHFQQAIALASEVLSVHGQNLGSIKKTFTPEVGIVPVLYIIGVKCRHPLVRRKALRMLQLNPIREAAWDSASAAKVVERVIQIEEAGSWDGCNEPSAEMIPLRQRIEALSYVHIFKGQTAAKLDVSYTFCARDGIHNESIAIG